ncbi:hypothetical protein Rhal01_01568 [Rubritalea halochordaticola]|uniref:Type VI secretion system tube protein Hcp n=1 Tax=Rubritalea halochordaticola TaxID=714537 RepID=A0ABP9UY61_9BACT
MKFWLSLLFISLSLVTGSQAAYDIYARFVGGNAPSYVGDSNHENFLGADGWVELGSASFSLETTINIGSTSGGGGAGKASFGDVVLTKSPNGLSASFFAAAALGANYDTAEIVFVRSGGAVSGGQTFLKFEMKMVFVSSIGVEGNSGGDQPDEKVVLKHGAQRLTFYKQNNDGSTTALTPVSWSVVLNNATFQVQ